MQVEDLIKLSVVIPAYNEAKRIQEVIQALPPEILSCSVETVVVDDGSRDDTALIAHNCGARVISHAINRGQGAALQSGFDYCLKSGADIIVTFDADGQHSADEIPTIIQPILDNKALVVLGSRFLTSKPKNIPTFRYLLLKSGVLFTRVISQIRVTDTHNGFRAFHRSALTRINIIQDKMEHASEILDQISTKRLPYTEVPVTIAYTDYSLKKGQSNSNAIKIALKLLLYKLR